MSKIVEVRPLEKYKLDLRFADGTQGKVDLSEYAGKGVFKAWDEPGKFERVALGSSGELVWDEDLDLCADALYLRLTGKKPEELFPSLKESGTHA